jgi:hypothetical protein
MYFSLVFPCCFISSLTISYGPTMCETLSTLWSMDPGTFVAFSRNLQGVDSYRLYYFPQANVIYTETLRR